MPAHDWNDHWYNHHVNNHYHNWYHGCWNGHWGGGWYSPLVWGAAGYGLGSWWSNSTWGYGPSYYNPYYTEPTDVSSAGYDYSQPVVVNNYVSSDTDATGGTAQVAQETPATQEALTLFDDAMADFKGQRYLPALGKVDSALKKLPNDPVLHEFRSLCLFAVGRYTEAAAGLNSLLASSPGMDWTSMSSLYGDADVYTAQLRTLETHVKGNPKDAAAVFVLCYHYLVIGENEKAIKGLRRVLELQPNDATAQRMLASLVPPNAPPADASKPSAETDSAAPQTDLVGRWMAKGGETTIELTIDEQSKFTWKAMPAGKPPTEVTGSVVATNDTLVLDSPQQGAMVGRVKSGGADRFSFAMQGIPPGDPGLDFRRAQATGSK